MQLHGQQAQRANGKHGRRRPPLEGVRLLLRDSIYPGYPLVLAQMLHPGLHEKGLDVATWRGRVALGGLPRPVVRNPKNAFRSGTRSPLSPSPPSPEGEVALDPPCLMLT